MRKQLKALLQHKTKGENRSFRGYAKYYKDYHKKISIGLEPLNRAKYYDSTLSFIRNHAIKEEHYKIIELAVNKASDQDEIEKFGKLLSQKSNKK